MASSYTLCIAAPCSAIVSGSKKTRQPPICFLSSKPPLFSSSSSSSSSFAQISHSFPHTNKKWYNLSPPAAAAAAAEAAAAEVVVEEEEESTTTEISSPPAPVEVQLAAEAASESPKGQDVFAVVMIGSRQYIVIPGRFLYVQRLKDANVNDKIVLSKVLLVGTKDKAYIGQPVVTNAAVHAVVEEQGLNKKVIVFKYKKKKHYRRNIGHRQVGESSNIHPGELKDHYQLSAGEQNHSIPNDQPKLKCRELQERKIQLEASKPSQSLDITEADKFRMWKKGFPIPTADSFLKYMKDQIILARVYSSIAYSYKNTHSLSQQLSRQIKENTDFIGEANSDYDLQDGADTKAIKLGNLISTAENKFYNCGLITRKLRALAQTRDENVKALKSKSMFLMKFVSFSIQKSLHCLYLQLTNDYFVHHSSKKVPNDEKIVDPSLYHYAIFSDNVLATWVVVNSTVMNSKKTEKHVFHIITDRLQFPAMKMWFIAHPLLPATVHVESVDEYKWLNSSYCPAFRQLESAYKMKEQADCLKYKNPKYLSVLNHIRFYMPQLFPKLDKILFLDDDVVVQKDLTPLWSIDMKGMVNGAVETCKTGVHEFRSYLNFSSPEISQKFDPHSCVWAFGMNIFDLKQWRIHNLTGVYHYWQDLNKDRQFWNLGTLPPGLITFYNLTYLLDRSWHLTGLGYLPSINISDIEKAAVIHFAGNNKPWLALGYPHFKGYWSKYVQSDDPYINSCNINL